MNGEPCMVVSNKYKYEVRGKNSGYLNSTFFLSTCHILYFVCIYHDIYMFHFNHNYC